jgi:hypothetical protein
MYKIFLFLKDRFLVKHKGFFTGLLKSMIDKSRLIRVEKLLKNNKIKIEWYIPGMINRLNHALNNVFNRKFFLFLK